MIKITTNLRRVAVVLAMAAALMFTGSEASAQIPGKGHEIRIGIAGMPMGASLARGFFLYDDYNVLRPFESTSDRYRDYRRRGISFGTLTGEYLWNINARNAFGVNIGFDILFGRLFDGYSDEPKGWQEAWGVALWPEYRHTWNPYSRVKAYFSVSAGIGGAVYHNMNTTFSRFYDSKTGEYQDENPWSMVPVLQFTPVGLSFGGDRVFGFAELGIGTMILGGRAGVGFKF